MISSRLWFPFVSLQSPLVGVAQGCNLYVLRSNNSAEKTWRWQSVLYPNQIIHGYGRHVKVLASASRWKASGAELERGVFDSNLSPEMIERAVDHADRNSQEKEDEGLIPQQWLTLQDNLHKTKNDKKLELRLQAIESSMQKAAELQVKRQKLENATVLPKEDILLSSDFSLRSSGHAVEENTTVSPETTARVYMKDSISSQARPPDKNFFFDPELDHWFNEDEIADLKRSEPDLTKCKYEKWLPLQVLAASGQFFLLDEYLKLHVNVNLVDEDGYTPLHRAVMGRKELAVSQLLKAGADVNVVDKDGASLLHYSVQTGSLNLVRLLVRCGVDLNLSDKKGWTALHVAALTGREDIVRHLLVSGADQHQMTKERCTPLDLCLAAGKGYKAFAIAKNLKRLPRKNTRCCRAEI